MKLVRILSYLVAAIGLACFGVIGVIVSFLPPYGVDSSGVLLSILLIISAVALLVNTIRKVISILRSK